MTYVIRRTYLISQKYGCGYCLDLKNHTCDQHECKYASILDQYDNYEQYDKEMENLCPDIEITLGRILPKYKETRSKHIKDVWGNVMGR